MSKSASSRPAGKSGKSKSAKSAPRTAKASSTPKVSPEEKAAAEILKLVDKAAGLLRHGIEEGAKQSASARTKVHKQAHGLLHKAVSSLDQLASSTTSVLHSTIDKTLGRPKR